MRAELRTALMLFAASLAFQALFITLDAFVSDEGIVLVASEDVANGRLLYRDINVPLTPAVYLLQGIAFKSLGPSLLLSRALIAIANALGVVLVFLLAHSLLPLRRAAVAGAFAIPLQVWMWPHAQYFSYNTIAILLAMLAIRLAWSIETSARPRRSALWLGVAFGAGLWTKPNIPLAIGAGVLLYWCFGWLRSAMGWPHARTRRFMDLFSEGCFVLSGIALASLPMVLYLASVGILDDMVQNMIAISRIYDDSPAGLFPEPWPLTAQIDGVRTSPGLVMPGMLINGTKGLAGHQGYQYLTAFTGWVDAIIRIVYYLPVLLLLTVAVQLARALGDGSWSRNEEAAALVLATSSLLFLTILPFPAFHYMTPTLLPLVALVAYVGFRTRDRSSGVRRRLWGGLWGGMLGGYLAASVFAVVAYLSVPRAPVETPRGTLWMEQATARLWGEILEHTRSRMLPDDQIFAVPYFPLFYFLTDLEHPTRYVALGPGLPGRAAENEIIAELEREQVEFVLYTPGMEYPGLEEFRNAYPRLDGYIQRRFEVEREFYSLFGIYAQFMHRRSGSDEAPTGWTREGAP